MDAVAKACMDKLYFNHVLVANLVAIATATLARAAQTVLSC